MLSPTVPVLAAGLQRAALVALWRVGVQAQAGRRGPGPHGLALEVIPAPRDVPALLRSAPILSAALGRPVMLRQRGPAVVVDVSIAAPACQLADLPAVHGWAVPLGYGPAGRPVTLDLSAPGTPHVLIAGSTGSGKSNTVRVLARGLTAVPDVRVVAVDPDGRTFEGVPTVAVDVTDCRAAAAWARAELERSAAGAVVRPVVLIVDEAADVLRDATVRADVQAIASRGRKHGVHLVLATSDTSADSMPRAIISNVRARVVGAVVDYHAAAQAAGRSGAERLERPGTFVMHPGGIEVAVPFVDAETWRAAVSADAWLWRSAPVPAPVPRGPLGVPPDVWGWIWDTTRDGSQVPGVGRIAARGRVGKARAAAWRAVVLAWDGWDGVRGPDDSRAVYEAHTRHVPAGGQL